MEKSNNIEKFGSYLCVLLLGYMLFSFFINRFPEIAYPDGDFLCKSDDMFMDFFNTNCSALTLNVYRNGNNQYPPFIILIAHILSRFAPYKIVSQYDLRWIPAGMISFIAVFVVSITSLFTVLIRFLVKRKIPPRGILIFVISMLFSAPFLFLVDRGNYLIIALAFFVIFCLSFHTNPKISAVFIGLSAAIKIYPGLLMILFITEKKKKEFFLSLITCLFVTLLSFAFFEGNIIKNIFAFVRNLTKFGNGMPYWYMDLYFSCGLSTIVKSLYGIIGSSPFTDFFPVMMVYTCVAFLILVFSIFAIWREVFFWRRLLLLTLLIVFLTPNSYLYNLTFLIGPLVIFLTTENLQKRNNLYFYALLVLFAPTAYYYFNPKNALISISVPINCCLVLFMIVSLIITSIFPRKYSIEITKALTNE